MSEQDECSTRDTFDIFVLSNPHALVWNGHSLEELNELSTLLEEPKSNPIVHIRLTARSAFHNRQIRRLLRFYEQECRMLKTTAQSGLGILETIIEESFYAGRLDAMREYVEMERILAEPDDHECDESVVDENLLDT